MSVWARGWSPPLGLDIGRTAVKAVAVSRLSRAAWRPRRDVRYRIDGFGSAPLPTGGDGIGNISDAVAVGEAVRRACRAAAPRRRTATVAVADAAVTTRTVLLDASLTAAELEVEAVLEAERCIPHSIDDVALDFAPIGLFPGDEGLRRVLLVACPKADVAARVAVLREAGLEAACVETESLALRRAAGRALRGESSSAVLDLGGAGVRLVAWDADDVAYAREAPLAGGSADDDALLDAAAELLAGYAAARPGSGLQRLLVVGGGARRPGFGARAADRLGVAVETAQPFAGVAAHARLDSEELARAGPTYATAFGLGLRCFP